MSGSRTSRVQVWLATETGGERDNRATVRTDDEGRYRIETPPTIPQFGEPNIHVAVDGDERFEPVFIRRVVDLDDKRARREPHAPHAGDEGRRDARPRPSSRSRRSRPPCSRSLSDHFAGEPLLLASTTCAALAVGALAVQPLLAAAGPPARTAHRATGTVIVVLVLLHVALLFILAPDDALFAMSPDGPTRARMALIATCALLIAALLGALGPSSRLSRHDVAGRCTPTWACW